MNNQDRERMARLYSVLANLPWPNRGRTIGPADLSRFFSNMEDLTPMLMQTVMSISRCDSASEDPDAELDDLERELSARRKP